MSGLSRTAFLGACAAVIIGCGSGTEPSTPTTGNSRFPMLTNYGGHLLSPLRLVVVVAANDSLRDSLFAFAKAMPTSQWWPAVATPFGVSPTATAFTVIGPPMAPGTQLTGGGYCRICDGGGDRFSRICRGRAYHVSDLSAGRRGLHQRRPVRAVSSLSRAFRTVRRVGCRWPKPKGFHTMMEAMTLNASHEIIESATDPEGDGWKLESPFPPWTGSPWGLDDDRTSEENADMCEGTRYPRRRILLSTNLLESSRGARRRSVRAGDPDAVFQRHDKRMVSDEHRRRLHSHNRMVGRNGGGLGALGEFGTKRTRRSCRLLRSRVRTPCSSIERITAV